MRTLKFEDREEWLAARRGKITGSRLKDIIAKRGSGRKIGFYELIAERLGIADDGEETPMDRGTRLEAEAIERFMQETGKKVDTSLVIWARDDDESIAISPDGFIAKKVGKKTVITEACETKCLASARHIEAWLTKEIPSDYEFQKLQYFIVNDQLEQLHFMFYDPRLIAKPFFFFTIERKDVQAEVDEYLAYERGVLAEVEIIVNQLTF